MAQTGSNYVFNYKVESVTGTAATGGAATGERLRNLGGGLALTRVPIVSNTKRNDANKSKPRLGAKRVTGQIPVELAQGECDTLFEAFFRSTWVAPVAVTFDNGAALTSITVTDSSTLTFAGTTVPTAFGLRVGDVFRLTNMSTAANNSINLRVKTIAGSVVTVHGTPLTTQAADTACTLTIAKKLIQATTPTRRSFTFEQYLEDLDESERFVGCRVTSLSLTFQPGGMVVATWGFMGMDRSVLATGSSPYFTSPTEYTSTHLIADDASITYNGAAIVTMTGWTLNFTIAADGVATLGSVVTPDIFDNDLSVESSMQAIPSDLTTAAAAFDAETEFEMSILLVEPESEPKSFISIYCGAVKIMGIDGQKGGDNAYIETRGLAITPRVAATGYDAGVCTICTG